MEKCYKIDNNVCTIRTFYTHLLNKSDRKVVNTLNKANLLKYILDECMSIHVTMYNTNFFIWEPDGYAEK